RIRLLTYNLRSCFADLAAVELDEVRRTSSLKSHETPAIAWELAFYDFSRMHLKSALRNLDAASSLSPALESREMAILLRIELLNRLGRHDEANAALEAAVTKLGETPQICLAASNTLLRQPASRSRERDRLNWINKCLVSAELSPLDLRDPTRPLSFDNLTGVASVKQRLDGAPKLSVIMPAYNAAATIRAAI